jgi:PilZ domain
MFDDAAGNRHGSSEASNVEPDQSDRRQHPRFPFTASVEAIEPQSRAKIKARISDIGLGGCYVDTINPFAVGTVIKIRLTKDKVTFEADAKVIFSQVGMGMGVAFISAMPRQLRIFQKWLNEIASKSLTELELPGGTESDVVAANSVKNPDFVLRELLIALMQKGVLSEAEGKELLQKLHRYTTK